MGKDFDCQMRAYIRKVTPKRLNRTAISLLLTTIVVAFAVLLGPMSVEAVLVSLAIPDNSIYQGESITFNTDVRIKPTERIPIQNVYLRIFSDSGCTAELVGAPYNSPCVMTLISATPSTGYSIGYGFGYDPDDGPLYSLGYGYGYSGYGYSGGVTLTYSCTLTTSTLWSTGTYFARTDVDGGAHIFSSSAQSFLVMRRTEGPAPGLPTPTPEVTSTPAPTSTPEATTTPGPTSTPEVTGTPGPTSTPGASPTIGPTATSGPTATPEAGTPTPQPTSTPAPGGDDGGVDAGTWVWIVIGIVLGLGVILLIFVLVLRL